MKATWVIRGMFLSLLALMIACRPPRTGPVYFERGATFALLPPGTGPTFFSQQEVVLTTRDGREETILCTVESDPQRLSLVTSTPMGQTLFIVQVRPEGTQVETRLPVPSALDPRLIVAFVQLSAWPLEQLQPRLGKGLSLTEDGGRRWLRAGTRIVLMLEREGTAPQFRRITLDMPTHATRAVITTLEDRP